MSTLMAQLKGPEAASGGGLGVDVDELPPAIARQVRLGMNMSWVV